MTGWDLRLLTSVSVQAGWRGHEQTDLLCLPISPAGQMSQHGYDSEGPQAAQLLAEEQA